MLRLRYGWLLLLAASAAAQRSDLRRGSATEAGIDPAGLRAAATIFADAVAADEVRGAVLMVVCDRRIVLHEAYGWRDRDGRRPMRKDSLFRMASNTKAITAAAVLALVDDGALTVEDPIRRWFPTFDHGQTADITVRHLLTHTSGLRIDTLFLQPLLEKSDAHPDAPNLVLEAARFGGVGAAVEPGTSYSYSNPGYNTLAALVEVVSERPFAEFVRERFYEPLGMRDSCNHESRADHRRMSAVFRGKTERGWRVGWQPGDDPDYPFVRGSGGMISTARDYATFCQMMLDGGMWNGERILSEEVVRAATTSQTGLEEHGYGFGWRIRGDGSFEHSGSDGTMAWCDPERRLIGLVLTQSPGKVVDRLRKTFRDRVTAACAAREPGGR